MAHAVALSFRLFRDLSVFHRADESRYREQAVVARSRAAAHLLADTDRSCLPHQPLLHAAVHRRAAAPVTYLRSARLRVESLRYGQAPAAAHHRAGPFRMACAGGTHRSRPSRQRLPGARASFVALPRTSQGVVEPIPHARPDGRFHDRRPVDPLAADWRRTGPGSTPDELGVASDPGRALGAGDASHGSRLTWRGGARKGVRAQEKGSSRKLRASPARNPAMPSTARLQNASRAPSLGPWYGSSSPA